MNKEKCAFDRIDKCVALKEKQCKGCTYYKTADQLSADREKSRQRLVDIGGHGLIDKYAI